MRHTCIVAVAFAASLAMAACDRPKDDESEDVVETDTMEETVVVPPTVSEDAPSEPHMGEPPSPNQPQPVVPEEPEETAEPEEPEAAVDEDAMGETVVVPPTVSADAPSEPHMGEPPSPSQPQPVVPGDGPETPEAETDDIGALLDIVMPEGETVVIDESAETMVVSPAVSEDAPAAPHQGEPPSPKQPQPAYPDGEPDGQ